MKRKIPLNFHWKTERFSFRNTIEDISKHFNGSLNDITSAFVKVVGSDEFLKRFSKAQPYGIADKKDFGSMSVPIALLCAYNNKQYYLYKAESDKNKVGFLSRKQYLKYSCIKKRDELAAKEYKANNGRMITLYKMVSNAIKENPYAKFFECFESFFADWAKDVMELFCRQMHNLHSPDYTLRKCSVQDAYNLHLRELKLSRGRGIGSGERYAVTSCMEMCQIAPYYEAFNVQAYFVCYQNMPIGRFLTWKTNKGRICVDRLYCNGYDAPFALQAMRNEFGDEALYYPFNKLPTDEYIESVYNSKFKLNMVTPYVDSFYNIYYNKTEKRVMLTNSEVEGSYCFNKFNRTPRPFEFCGCGELLDKSLAKVHPFICVNSNTKIRNKEDYIEMYRLYQEVLNETV